LSDSAEYLALISDVGSQPFHNVHAGQDHRHCPVRRGTLEFLSEVVYNADDLFMFRLDSCALLRSQMGNIQSLNKVIFGMAMFQNASETVLERLQFAQALQVLRKVVLRSGIEQFF
jgi:hypothetical protein